MPQEAITIPNTGRQLYDGDIVMLQRFPEVDWIIHKDWYMYQGTQSYGWYFVSIPDETILPVNNYDLETCTVIYSQQSPIPGPDDAEFTKDDAKNLNSAFITVDNIAARDNLDIMKLVNGKIVKVNNVDGEVKYYSWVSFDNTWEEVSFGANVASLSDNQLGLLSAEDYNKIMNFIDNYSREGE